jgi:N4-(beta-N-acetylglucosaminyl)-L-asparaginase
MNDGSLPRRGFLSTAAWGVVAGAVPAGAVDDPPVNAANDSAPKRPEDSPITVIASANGLAATERAYAMLLAGKDPLDAVVAGVAIAEADPKDTSVGYGGLPNEDGIVELDAAVMHGPTHRAGAVAGLRNIKHPAQVAKKVLECTDHVLLVGDQALRFARAMGFSEEELLTERARRIWLHWRLSHSDNDDWLVPEQAVADPETSEFFRRHTRSVAVAGHGRLVFERPTGTIHCSAMNAAGDVSCTTTTSGLAFKIPGRVGDSPIVGAGLYVDNAVGSCGSTGRGEANLQNLSSFAAVELMRGGMSPRDAGLEICRRIVERTRRRDLLDEQGRPTFDLKFYLLDKQNGRHAGVSLYGPAQYAVTDAHGTRLEACECVYPRRV